MFTPKELLKKCGSPLYVYNYDILYRRCMEIKQFRDDLRAGLPDGICVNMHYSTKSNNNPTILSIIKEAGLNVDCMSPYELEVDKKSGFTTDRMLYVCNNITAEEMRFVHDEGILICLDSISQVETWGKQFPGTDIMVRINPGTSGIGFSEKVTTSGKETKFGISGENLFDLFKVADQYDLHIIGVHQHLGTLFLDDKIPEYIEGVKAGLSIIKKAFTDVRIVDLGGGFGVPYKPNEKPLNLRTLASKLLPFLEEFVSDYPSIKEFKFEPGRYLPCEAGFLLGNVTSVKHENRKWWVGTDIGMNQLVRPSMYDSYHKISIVHQDPDKKRSQILANICGNICESGDILGKERLIKYPDVGDIVVVHNAGAYGYSMASNYTGRPRPAEVMIKNDEATIIRSRENLTPIIEKIVVL